MLERLARPPRVLSIAATCWLLLVLGAYSDAGVGLEGLFLFVYGAVLLAVAWVARGGLFLLARPRPAVASAGHRWWAVVPLAIVTAVVLGWQFDAMPNHLFRARFRLSEAALTRYAEGLLAGPSTASMEARWVGLFRISRSETHAGQARLITTSCGVIDSCGLLYAPAGPPQRWQEDRFSHLRGRWWHLFEGF